MAIHENEAIVLKILDYGESDKIIIFLTPDFGKITAIAKGAKRSKIRFVRKLELFTRLHIRFADNKYSDMVRIDEAELLAPYPGLSQDYERFLCASLVCELLINWAANQNKDTNLYNLAVWTLSHLALHNPISTLLLFQLHLLTFLGFHLHLSSCCLCSKTVQAGLSFVFVAENNGIICQNCIDQQDEKPQSTPLSIGSLKILEKARAINIDKWSRFHFSRNSLREVTTLFQFHNHYLLQRDIISWQHLEEYLRESRKI